MTIDKIRKEVPEGATHYEVDGTETHYYAKDYMGRWCCFDDCGNMWPMRSSEHEMYDEELMPLQ